jgi:hypothetical protein
MTKPIQPIRRTLPWVGMPPLSPARVPRAVLTGVVCGTTTNREVANRRRNRVFAIGSAGGLLPARRSALVVRSERRNLTWASRARTYQGIAQRSTPLAPGTLQGPYSIAASLVFAAGADQLQTFIPGAVRAKT